MSYIAMKGEASTSTEIEALTNLTELDAGSSTQAIRKTGPTTFENIDVEVDTNDKVRYDTNDPLPGYLSDKTIAGTGITLSEGTGANENKLEITSTITQATRDSLGLDTDDTVTFGNLSGTNTGDQTSMSGISDTKANFDTALSDGNFMYSGDAPTAHASSHAVGGADTIFPADPGSDKFLMWDDDPGQLVWATVTSSGATTALDNLASVAINTTLVSDTDNTDALGTAAIAWSDLFLGSGSVITWSTAPSTADVTLTHSANTLTLAGGDLALGANNLTMTGSLGATGAGKLTKIWSVDAEFTNLPTINGGTLAAALTTLAPLSGPTFTGTVTLPKTLEIQDTSADHQYVLAVSELTADRTITLPLLTGADTFVFQAHIQTLTNKRITQRVATTTDDATAVIDIDTTDVYELSAIANATEFTTTGTPTDGQKLIIRLKDAGVAKALTWTGFTAIGITLPTTTVAGKWHYIGATYNSAASAWHAIAYSVQA